MYRNTIQEGQTFVKMADIYCYSYWPENFLRYFIGYNCPMKCHRLYVVADFENLSSDTLKMADISCYGLRYGKCEWGVTEQLILYRCYDLSEEDLNSELILGI